MGMLMLAMGLALAQVNAQFLTSVQYKGNACAADAPIVMNSLFQNNCAAPPGCVPLYSYTPEYPVQATVTCNATLALSIPRTAVNQTYLKVTLYGTQDCSGPAGGINAFLANGTCVRASNDTYIRVNACGQVVAFDMCIDPDCDYCQSMSAPSQTCIPLNNVPAKAECLIVGHSVQRVLIGLGIGTTASVCNNHRHDHGGADDVRPTCDNCGTGHVNTGHINPDHVNILARHQHGQRAHVHTYIPSPEHHGHSHFYRDRCPDSHERHREDFQCRAHAHPTDIDGNGRLHHSFHRVRSINVLSMSRDYREAIEARFVQWA